MAEDPFLSSLVLLLEEVADSLRARIDGIEHCLDVQVAPPEQLRWTGAWLGLVVEPSLPEPRQRALIRETGRTLGWRGTRQSLERLVAAVIDTPVAVSDTCGVYPQGGTPVAAQPPTVVIQAEHTGGIDQRQLLAFVTAELPPGTAVDLQIGPIGDKAHSQIPPTHDQLAGSTGEQP